MKKNSKNHNQLMPESELPDMESVNERKHPEPRTPEEAVPRHNNEGTKTHEPAEGGVQTVEEAIRFQVKKTEAA